MSGHGVQQLERVGGVTVREIVEVGHADRDVVESGILPHMLQKDRHYFRDELFECEIGSSIFGPVFNVRAIGRGWKCR